MNLLIDGHNLIGSKLFNDIRLSDEDDEAKLVMRLKIWQSRVKGTITVVFDRGIPGGIDVRMGSSGVEVVFAANPAQADDLIKRRLQKAKQGLVLVTNDEALLREAAVYGVTAWRGAEFVDRMRVKGPLRAEAGTELDPKVSKEEVEEWLAIFKARAEARRQLRLRLQKDAPPPTPGKSSKKATGTTSGKQPKPPTSLPPKPSSPTIGKLRKESGKGSKKK